MIFIMFTNHSLFGLFNYSILKIEASAEHKSKNKSDIWTSDTNCDEIKTKCSNVSKDRTNKPVS